MHDRHPFHIYQKMHIPVWVYNLVFYNAKYLFGEFIFSFFQPYVICETHYYCVSSLASHRLYYNMERSELEKPIGQDFNVG